MKQNIPTVFFQILVHFFISAMAAKLRSWRGPEMYFEGPLPSQRQSHGFVSYGEKLVLFGGESGGRS